jgi:SAM-dependent methyltransferase
MVTDNYADGSRVSARRAQKAEILAEALAALLPGRTGLEIVDFGCADGAVPVRLLASPFGAALARITGITLLNYNDLTDKPAHAHPRFTRVIGDLEGDLAGLPLPWGACDAVLATAFFHYLHDPAVAFRHAARLLTPGGWLLAGMPARWVLALRRHGLPLLLPRNNYIRQLLPLDGWRAIAEDCGFTEISRQAVQWLGLAATASLERCFRRRRWLAGWGSNWLVVYRRNA